MKVVSLMVILAIVTIVGSQIWSRCSSGSACNKIRNDNWRKQKNGKLTVCCVSSAAPYIQLKQQKNGKRICTCQRKPAAKPSYTRTKPGEVFTSCASGLACNPVPYTSFRKRKDGEVTFCCPSASTPYIWFIRNSYSEKGSCICKNTVPKTVEESITKRATTSTTSGSKKQVTKGSKKPTTKGPKNAGIVFTNCVEGLACNKVPYNSLRKQNDGEVIFCCPSASTPYIWFIRNSYSQKALCICKGAPPPPVPKTAKEKKSELIKSENGIVFTNCTTGLACNKVTDASLKKLSGGNISFCCPSASFPYVWFIRNRFGQKGFCICKKIPPPSFLIEDSSSKKTTDTNTTKKENTNTTKTRDTNTTKTTDTNSTKTVDSNTIKTANTSTTGKPDAETTKKNKEKVLGKRIAFTHCVEGLACNKVPYTSLRKQKYGEVIFCCPSASTPYIWFIRNSNSQKEFCKCERTPPPPVPKTAKEKKRIVFTDCTNGLACHKVTDTSLKKLSGEKMTFCCPLALFPYVWYIRNRFGQKGFCMCNNEDGGYQHDKDGSYQQNENMGYQQKEDSGYQQNEDQGYQHNEDMGYQQNEDMGYQQNEDRGYQQNEDSGYQQNEDREFQYNEDREFQYNEDGAYLQSKETGCRDNKETGCRDSENE